MGDIHFEKTSGKDVWRSITRDEIISDYKTKAVNVDAYRRRNNNIVTQQKKITNAALQALGGNYNLLIHCSARTRRIQTG